MRLIIFVFTISILSCSTRDKNIHFEQSLVSLKGIEEDSSGKEAIQFSTKLLELGNIDKDTLIEGRFVLKNFGKQDVKINYVNPDCTCTNYDISKDYIPVNDSIILTLRFDTSGYTGDQNLTAVISTDSEIKFYKVQMKFTIIN
ncbi:MAG: DUF1573 domain-containing protein [Algoriphagus aquaeductus]|uniref:DUF1573 domain-containing protein n=1 Tax=Algoriphagus aquaeductus TaxID=475299 RepID=UPI00391B0A53